MNQRVRHSGDGSYNLSLLAGHFSQESAHMGGEELLRRKIVRMDFVSPSSSRRHCAIAIVSVR